jgi:glycosyltransferase involved in cell wall biosynthesis
MVTHAFPPEGCGGTERYVEAVAHGIAARGHQVEVLSGSLEWRAKRERVRDERGPVPVTRLHRDDLHFDHWDKGPHPWVAAEFEAAIDRFRPDVVHLNHWIRLGSDLVRRAAARGVPSVVHLHDLYTSCPRVFRLRPGPRGDGVDVPCREALGPAACGDCVPRFGHESASELAAALARYGGDVAAEYSAAVVRLAPSPTHATRVAYHAPAAAVVEVLAHPRLKAGIVAPAVRADSAAGRLRVTCATLLAPLKGAHVLLAAARRLAEDAAVGAAGSGVSIDFHGGFATPEYEARLRALASGQDVRFHGPYVADEPCRTPGDAVVVPTLAPESWSFWLDEAGRMALPIVASDAGAIGERARATRSPRVRLVPPGDVEALATALRELRDDPALRARMVAGPAPDGIELEEHLSALEARYQRARVAGPPAVAPLPPPETLEPEFAAREAALRAGLLRQEKSGAPPGTGAERDGR